MRNCFGFEHSFEDEKRLIESLPVVELEVPEKESDEIMQLVFAPDPETGLPSSALGMYLKTSNEKVRDVIRTHFMTGQSTGVNGIDDPDFVLDSMQRYNESRDEYISRLFSAAQDVGINVTPSVQND